MQIWIRMEYKQRPNCVSVESDAIIVHVIKAGLTEEKLHDVPASDVSVKFQGEEVRPGAAVSGYTNTADDNPLVFALEGM